jgi:tRNA/rRNA methyltransferase
VTACVRLDNVAIVLHRPHFPGNIGSTARAACNMGLDHLVVVAPENYDRDLVLPMATHVARTVVDGIRFHDDLNEALAAFTYVVGTTARRGGERQIVVSPAQMARDLIAISQDNKVALLFGPEDRGLTNEELRLCHQLVTIPTADFASLNLAQAVMVLCYEIFTAGGPAPKGSVPRLATRHELDGMYAQLKDVLVRINYIQPENPDYWMNKLRRFFSRVQLRAGEVSIIRGICRQIDWYAGHRYREGRRSAGDDAAE